MLDKILEDIKSLPDDAVQELTQRLNTKVAKTKADIKSIPKKHVIDPINELKDQIKAAPKRKLDQITGRFNDFVKSLQDVVTLPIKSAETVYVYTRAFAEIAYDTTAGMARGSKQISTQKPTKGTTYKLKRIKCGKNCSGCPHGPYWYAYWREGDKVKSKYLGKNLRWIN